MPAKDPEQRRATSRAWYARNKQVLSKRDATPRRRNRATRKRAIALWYAELKSQLACRICAETHPACIQFHHPDPLAKETSVATAVRRGWGRARILDEIQKCEVLCANCHAKHHARGTAP
jgi:hypothetical protein